MLWTKELTNSFEYENKPNLTKSLFCSPLFSSCTLCVSSMSTSGRRTPLDHGVQIRFINDQYDNRGVQAGSLPKTRTQNKNPSKYGVAVRVQGIAGQPYVFLKDGEKGDSYGVQIRTQNPPGYNSLPRRREKVAPGTQGAGVRGEDGQGGGLRRAQSHGSLLDRDGEGGAGEEDIHLSRPPGDGKSGSYGNLDGRIGLQGEGDLVWHGGGREGDMRKNAWDDLHNAGLYGSATSSQSYHDQPQQTNELPYQMQTSRLTGRFDSSNTGAQQRELPPKQKPRATSPVLNHSPFSSHPSSTQSSLGRGQKAVPKSPGQTENQLTPPGRYPAVKTPQANLTEAQVRISFTFGYSSSVLCRLQTPHSMQHCKRKFLVYVSR